LLNVLVKGAVTVGGSGFTAFIGGIAGLMTVTSSIYNAYSNLNLIVNTNPGTSNSLYVGGIAGSMGNTSVSPVFGDAVSVKSASCVGNITVGATSPVNVKNPGSASDATTEGLCVGGIAGLVNGVGTGARAVADNCDYRTGSISVKIGTGGVFSGGGVGKTYCYSDIKNSCALASSFSVEKTGTENARFVMGGFIGSFYSNGSFSSSSLTACYSEGPITAVIGNVSATSRVIAGGFAGTIGAPVSFCYAKGAVSALGYNEVHAGGFAGGIYYGECTNCFATGSINAQRGVSADNNVGGLIGLIESTDSKLKNSAALGARVVATGPGTRNVGRVFGTNNSGTSTNNYAFNSMALYSNATYAYPISRITPTYGTSNATGKDGADAHLGNFNDPTFWSSSSKLNFPSNRWIFSTTTGRGYPILKGTDGMAMGGQYGKEKKGKREARSFITARIPLSPL